MSGPVTVLLLGARVPPSDITSWEPLAPDNNTKPVDQKQKAHKIVVVVDCIATFPFYKGQKNKKLGRDLEAIFSNPFGFVLCGSLFLSLYHMLQPNLLNPTSIFCLHIAYVICSSFLSISFQTSTLRAFPYNLKTMSSQDNGSPEFPMWPEFKLPDLLSTDTIRQVHATIENEWDPLQRSGCQTAAGRALWNHVIHDPLADILAGESYLKSFHEKIKKDCVNKAREISGVILAVRTLWFDSKLEAALHSFNDGEAQVVFLGAGMDARAYRLSCLKESHVFEVDFPDVLQIKATLLKAAMDSTNDHQCLMMTAKSLTRVAADIRSNNWLEKLQTSGFVAEKNTVWVLEGILYYLTHSEATQVLETIADKCSLTHTVLLADFMNKPSTTLSNSTFHFYSDWPDHLLPSLGFSHVKLSQIGDPDAHFGLMHDPLNLFNKLRSLPRSLYTHPDDGTPCCRLYLVEASGSPNQTIP